MTCTQRPTFLFFDRDVPGTLSHITANNQHYKDWGKRVYSIALPVPLHRQATPEISIEFYYQDSDIQQEDENGRRLFMGTEFNTRTGLDKTGKLTCTERNKWGKPTIIDQYVFRTEANSEENIALSKNQFANYVLSEYPGFDDFDLAGFFPLFQLIEDILAQAT